MDNKNITFKKTIYVLISLTITICVSSMMIKGYKIKHDLEKNGKITIGKYVSRKNYPKSTKNYFIFYQNGKKNKANGGRSPGGFTENIGKFYKIVYSERYIGKINALFDQEVKDTVLILKAGFKLEDI